MGTVTVDLTPKWPDLLDPDAKDRKPHSMDCAADHRRSDVGGPRPTIH